MKIYTVNNATYYGETYGIFTTFDDAYDFIVRMGDACVQMEIWDTEKCKNYTKEESPNYKLSKTLTFPKRSWNKIKVFEITNQN